MPCLAAYGFGLRACMEVTFSEKFGKSGVILEHFLTFSKIVPKCVWEAPGGQRGPLGTSGNLENTSKPVNICAWGVGGKVGDVCLFFPIYPPWANRPYSPTLGR